MVATKDGAGVLEEDVGYLREEFLNGRPNLRPVKGISTDSVRGGGV